MFGVTVTGNLEPGLALQLLLAIGDLASMTQAQVRKVVLWYCL